MGRSLGGDVIISRLGPKTDRKEKGANGENAARECEVRIAGPPKISGGPRKNHRSNLKYKDHLIVAFDLFFGGLGYGNKPRLAFPKKAAN